MNRNFLTHFYCDKNTTCKFLLCSLALKLESEETTLKKHFFPNIFFSSFRPFLDRYSYSAIFMEKISMNSRVIAKIPFFDYQRFYSTWFRIAWHMGMFWSRSLNFFKTRFSLKCSGKNQYVSTWNLFCVGVKLYKILET